MTLRSLIFFCLAATSTNAAKAQLIQVPDTPKTIGETLQINSKRLSEQRELHIYLPASYAGSKHRYPVIYTLDGEVTGLVTANAVQFMTSYSGIPQMPEALVVAVTNANRNRDMPPPQDFKKGGQENFLAFLTDEVIPAIEQKVPDAAAANSARSFSRRPVCSLRADRETDRVSVVYLDGCAAGWLSRRKAVDRES